MNIAKPKSYIPQTRQECIGPEYNQWVRAKVQSSRESLIAPISDGVWQQIRAAQLAKQQAIHALSKAYPNEYNNSV